MNSAEFERPIPQALNDVDLESALAEAKQSPDGLLAAMTLLEQQEQLRTADEEALEAWLQSQPTQTQIDAEHYDPLANERSMPDEESLVDEIAPDAVPAPDDYESPDAVPAPDDYDLSEDDVPYDPILASEVTVTTTLNQIVADVNDAFSPIAASEEVTVVEEGELGSVSDALAASVNSEPTSSDLPRMPTDAKASTRLRFDWKSISLPVLVGATFAGGGASYVTVAAGLVLGAMVSWLIGLLALRSEQRSSSSHQVMARATFGVWGAVLPVTGHLAVRLLLTCGLLVWAVKNQMSTMGIPDEAIATNLTANNSGLYALVILVVLVIAALFNRVTVVVQSVLATAALALVILTGALNFASLEATTADLSSAVTIAVTFFVIDALILGPSRKLKSVSTFSGIVRSSLLRQLLPAIFSSIALSLILGMASATPAGSGDVSTNAIYTFIVDLGFLPILLAALSVGLELVQRVSEDLSSLRVAKSWAALSVVIVGGAGVLFLVLPIGLALSGLAPLLAALSLGSTVPYLTEVLMRRGVFHEVSLQRGYAFYRRFGIAALLGYVAVAVLGLLVSPLGLLGSGSLGFYITPLVGPATSVLYLLLIAVIWTVLTSSIRIKHQQNEVSALERRRNEIAGFDVFD